MFDSRPVYVNEMKFDPVPFYNDLTHNSGFSLAYQHPLAQELGKNYDN